MLRKTPAYIGLALLFLGIFCATSYAKTWIVGQTGTPCPNAQYTTVTDAVNAAAPGDVIAICPALHPEQLIITKPLTLRGPTVNGVSRVLLQPALAANFGGLPFEAVIATVNTNGVTIENLAVDASNNTVNGCTPSLAAIHYYNSSGTVDHNAIFGAQLANPQSYGGGPPVATASEFRSMPTSPALSVSRLSTTVSTTTPRTQSTRSAQA